MREVICIMAGFVAGGIIGVGLMCMLQINTINKYERKILKLQKELEASKKNTEVLCAKDRQ